MNTYNNGIHLDYNNGIHLDSEEQELLSLLKSIPAGHSLDEIEITDRLSWWVSDVFRVSGRLVAKGVPICFSSWTGWHDPASPDERETFWLARDQRDLDLMSRNLGTELEGIEKMLQGLEVARPSLTTTSRTGRDESCATSLCLLTRPGSATGSSDGAPRTQQLSDGASVREGAATATRLRDADAR